LADERKPSGLTARLAALPAWARPVLLVALVGVALLINKWLILILLLMLGLWMIVLLIGLAVLAIASTRRGGWTWMKRWLGDHLRGLTVPGLAVLTALLMGGLIIMITDPEVYALIKDGEILQAIGTAFANWAKAYWALYEGALGNPVRILTALGEWLTGGGMQPLLSALRGPSDTLVQSVPYIFAGLAVALGFRAGLFNIGAEGQIGIGWMVAVVVGFSLESFPAYILLPLAILAGMAAGGIWAGIAGVLKARTGAHEVITTIMLNYIAFRLSEWLLCGPLESVQGTCRTPDIAEAAFLPRFLGHPATVHWGFVLAIGAVLITHWYLFKTTWGFELRTVGANPNAAKYGGMNVSRTIILTMFLSGCLAGMAGVSQGLGITHNIALGFQAGYGFDSIALALLGKSQPFGVLGASLLFGVLRAGASRMQSVAGVPTEIVQIVQSLVIIFIAAPAIIQSIYRLRKIRRDETEVAVFTRGWGA
jgi:simple sugar transport system permease protein